MKPVGKRIVVVDTNEENKTDSGIIVGNLVDKDAYDMVGLVVETGPKVEQVKVGDKILFNKMSTVDFNHKAQSYRVLNEDSVMVIF